MSDGVIGPLGGGVMGRPVELLLVEDNPGDVELTREALEEARVRNRLSVVGDGVEALAFLRREGPYAGAPRPDLVMLDLNLPRKDGREVLAEIKQDPELRRIPVVVLTTSEAEKDVLGAYELHANAYIVKPVDLDQFLGVVRSVEGFWLAVVRLPSE
jgi:chemotaxis family two-component system response regulator Rcp1